MQTNPAVEQNKNSKWSESPWNQSARKRKGLWRKGFAEEPKFALSSEWKTIRVREDAIGDSEDGEEDDNELPCVIGESEGDCIW